MKIPDAIRCKCGMKLLFVPKVENGTLTVDVYGIQDNKTPAASHSATGTDKETAPMAKSTVTKCPSTPAAKKAKAKAKAKPAAKKPVGRHRKDV